jgi:hypothetical protein
MTVKRRRTDPLRSTQTLNGRRVASADCAVVAQGKYRATADEIPTLRKAPDPSGVFPVHPSLLRHADEQTVVGLAAVFLAIREGGLDPLGFGDWAVLAAPRFLGRATFERTFPTFLEESAWGVSPHLIPAHSLHSPSGTISQALQAHGPNLGVGGTPGGENEALLFAATLLLSGSVPGVWVILTGRNGDVSGDSPAGDYDALALALAASEPGFAGPRLRVSPDEVRAVGVAESSSRDIARWLAPGTYRLDAGHPSGAIPRPHSRLRRVDRETRND